MKALITLVLLLSMLSGEVYSSDACKVKLDFATIPEKKHQVVEVAEGVELSLVQMIATKNFQGAKVASNFICQVMTGATYTGSTQEWQGFVNSAMEGLSNSGYQKVEFIAVLPEDKIYKTGLQSIEYNFIATLDDNTQHIHNLAVLDKTTNTVYTVSVSGNELAKNEIKNEFERLVTSFVIKN